MIETNQTLDSIKDMLESGNSDDKLVVGKDEKLKLACKFVLQDLLFYHCLIGEWLSTIGNYLF